MSAETTIARDKWNRIYREKSDLRPQTAQILADHAYLLPLTGGIALDLACGLGGNALFLARRGFEVDAVDISETAIRALTAAAQAETLLIKAWSEDVTSLELTAERYEVIVVSRFLERSLARSIISALKSGGLLFYQTFTETRSSSIGPTNPRFLLRDNELLELFEGLLVRYYQEDARSGTLDSGRRNEAYLIAQKP